MSNERRGRLARSDLPVATAVGCSRARHRAPSQAETPSPIRRRGRDGLIPRLVTTCPAARRLALHAALTCCHAGARPPPLAAACTAERMGHQLSVPFLTDLRCACVLQIARAGPSRGANAAQALSGPAALNAVSDAVLRQHVLAVVQQAHGSEPRARAPLIAPFITLALLLRVNNMIAPLGAECTSGWGLQASLGRAVAALTGAPPPSTKEDAAHMGNCMQAAISNF